MRDPSKAARPNTSGGNSLARMGSGLGITATTGLPSALAAPASKKALLAFGEPGLGTTSTTPTEVSNAERRASSKFTPGSSHASSETTSVPSARILLPSSSAKGRSDWENERKTFMRTRSVQRGRPTHEYNRQTRRSRGYSLVRASLSRLPQLDQRIAGVIRSSR